MPSLGTMEAQLGRRLRALIGPLHRRRHHHALRRGSVDAERVRWAREQWWGDEPRWYPGGTPPRLHNRVTHLIDGHDFFAALHNDISRAQHYVYVIGWCLTPRIPLRRHTAEDLVETRLLAVLDEASQRLPVRILIWAGAPFLLQPTIRTTTAAQQTIEENCHGDMRYLLDHSAHISHCHHQKAIVIDGQIAYVGGMDLTTFQGDRWDTPGHPLREGPNWHDVQLRIEGEAVADVEHNFRQRWEAVSGADDLPHRDPAFESSWRMPAQIVRTIPKHVYPFAPHGEFGIYHAYIRTLRLAQRLIYLENQYLWSPDVMDTLIAAMNRPHDGPFRIVIVLPARAYDGKWDNDQHVSKLLEVDNGRGIVSVHSPYTSGPAAGVQAFTYRPIYVHAKVAIVDDEWVIVGSSNLNNRGLITDSEIDAIVHDADLARNLRIDLWAEHLNLPRDAIAGADPVALIDHTWVERGAENAEIIKRGDRPLICAAHRYEIGRMPGDWFLEEAEVLTFEH